MNTETERTEHATNIDQSVATMLVNVVSHDMSPIVRMVSESGRSFAEFVCGSVNNCTITAFLGAGKRVTMGGDRVRKSIFTVGNAGCQSEYADL